MISSFITGARTLWPFTFRANLTDNELPSQKPLAQVNALVVNGYIDSIFQTFPTGTVSWVGVFVKVSVEFDPDPL